MFAQDAFSMLLLLHVPVVYVCMRECDGKVNNGQILVYTYNSNELFNASERKAIKHTVVNKVTVENVYWDASFLLLCESNVGDKLKCLYGYVKIAIPSIRTMQVETEGKT